MKILGAVRHHAVVVADLDAARDFYGVLGFRRLHFLGAANESFVRQLSGKAWLSLDVCKLANEHGDVVECLRPIESEVSAISVGCSWSHIALTVSNCEEAIEELCELGATRVGGPVRDPDAPFRVSYLRDPWGNLIEIVESCGPDMPLGESSMESE